MNEQYERALDVLYCMSHHERLNFIIDRVKECDLETILKECCQSCIIDYVKKHFKQEEIYGKIIVFNAPDCKIFDE